MAVLSDAQRSEASAREMPSAGLSGLAEAGIADTLRVMSKVVLPTFGKGVIMRRPGVEAVSERWNLDLRAVQLMQALAKRYRRRSLLLKIPGRPHILVLNPRDVDQILAGSPEPFATRTVEKRAALAHIEPGNVLISDAPRRAETRPFHEQALATSSPCHPLAARFFQVVEEEMSQVLAGFEGRNAELDWAQFSKGWFRIVRRVTLGDSARDDEDLTEQLNRLRRRANWAFFAPKDPERLQQFRERLKIYIDRAEPGSLVGCAPAGHGVDAESQIPQWMFAFDPAGMATFRTLALLSIHPEYCEQVRNEAAASPTDRPFSRTCLLESLRLWPTTPAILRELVTDLDVGGKVVKKGTGILIFTPFFHRDDTVLSFAHRMCPQVWNDADAVPARGLVPFSAGPAICPAHHLVPLLASLTLGSILSRVSINLAAPHLTRQALPGTLNHFGIRLQVSPLC